MKAFVSRRQFAGSAGLLGLGAAAGLLQGMPVAWAQDYRALIVIDLAGGNDGHNVLIPTDAAYPITNAHVHRCWHFLKTF